MKKTAVIVLFLALCQHLFCQQYSVRVDAGYGLYNLKELKELQSYLLIDDILGAKSLEKFPSTVFYALSSECLLNKNDGLGIAGSFYSTGGRNHIEDYSGEYKLDMLLDGYNVGLSYRRVFLFFNTFNLSARLESGMKYSVLKLNEQLRILDVSSLDNNYTFDSFGFYAKPSVDLSYSWSKKISLNVSVGYEYDAKSTLHKRKDRDILLTIGYGESVHLDWSGIRTSIGMTYYVK